jgi:steroid delta-isomerase-like uncharacterized protein
LDVTGEELIHRWYEECVNQRRLDVVDEIMDEEYVGHSPPHAEPEPILGRAGAKRFLKRIFGGFPDARVQVEDLLDAEEKLAARVRMEGTHLGEYRGIPPTQRQFEITQTVVFAVADEKIRESWQEIDALGLMIQLGVVPPPGTGPLGLIGWSFGTVGRLALLHVRQRT